MKLRSLLFFFLASACLPQPTRAADELGEILKNTTLRIGDTEIRVPMELKAGQVTLETRALNQGEREKTSATIKILKTAFWHEWNEEIDNPNQAIFNIDLRTEFSFLTVAGRVLQSDDLSNLADVVVALVDPNGKFLAQSVTDSVGNFRIFGWVGPDPEYVTLRLSKSDFTQIDHRLERRDWHGTVGPFKLEPLKSRHFSRLPKQQHLISFQIKARDSEVSGLACSLRFRNDQGLHSSIALVEGGGLYSTLLSESMIADYKSCELVISTNPDDEWEDKTLPINDFSGPLFRQITLETSGESFVSGTFTNGSGTRPKILLIPNGANSASIEAVGISAQNKFKFTYKPGMEKDTYRLAIIWPAAAGSGLTPMWLSQNVYKAYPLGGASDRYALATDMELKVPKQYMDIFSRLTRFQDSKSTIVNGQLTPHYTAEVESVIQAVDPWLADQGLPKSLPLNVVQTFTLSRDNAPDLEIQENRFLEDRWLAVQAGNRKKGPLAVASLPIGMRLNVMEILSGHGELLQRLSAESPNLDIHYFSGNLQGQLADGSNYKDDLMSVSHAKAGRGAKFSNGVTQYLQPELERLNETDLELVLLLDQQYLAKCLEDSFSLPDLQIKNLLVVVFSNSFDPKMGGAPPYEVELKQAFEKVANVRHMVINPTEADYVQQILDLFQSQKSKPYQWIPFNP